MCLERNGSSSGSLWMSVSLRRVAKLVTDKACDSTFDIALENIESGTGRLIESEGEFSTDGVAFQAGDLLFGKLRPYLAKAWVADREGAAVGDFHVLRPQAAVDPKYLRYSVLEQQFLDKVNSSTFGAKMPRVSWEFLASMKLALPPYDQQLRIVRYLDRETEEIDDLIEKQERLIALLEEKRQAFISHAVTKGLDPTAPMKESGIPLLGEIPAHWSRCKVKHLFSLRNGHSLDSDEIVPEGDFPVYGGNGHRGFTRSYCFEGDHILIGRQGALCGNVHLAFGEFWATEHAIVARPARAMAMKFFGTVLDMMNLGQYSLSAAQPGIAGEFIGNLIVPLPPVDEQMVIAERIETHERDCFAVIRRSRESLRVLTERRAALISAAVTGKIDVTGRV